LHLLCARELGKNGRTFDGGRAFEVIATVPGPLVGVIPGTIARADVHDGHFIDLGRVPGEVVEQLAFWAIGNAGVGEHLVEGEPEDGDGRLGLGDLVLEVALVEDVALSGLNEEDDAFRMAELRVRVGVVGGLNSCG
jgi:hypothetical protein